ncbi:LysR family transcriptional regulator [Shewanella sp. AS16]|uniref:LysR family transcriptional regulator n=1 Tax=Shewanella sp. AS16 TaxID=2907625 RepID=UPI001F3F89A5|nr:LysR family transcriptional regulator [Shewanella sp. AS16]MCE9685640.1 LysR family transcriptional regulator [Shewanella sp. AS16]
MASVSDLAAVSVLAKECNFRTASEIIGVSTSALSRTIANVEKEVGARLFNRTTRSVSLTDAGRHFILKIEPALREINLAISEVRDIKSQYLGTIRINADEAIARQIINPTIASYLKDYPQMDIELISEGRLVDIVSEGYDAGIRTINNIPKDMIAIPIAIDRNMAVVASPDYLMNKKIPNTPDDLRLHECIREKYPSGRRYKWDFKSQNEIMSLDVPGRLTVNSYNLVIEACLSGVGIGYTGYHFVKPYIESGELCHLLKDWTVEWPTLCLYYPQGRNITSSMRAFIDTLKRQTEID